jgi:hypothetical protein
MPSTYTLISSNVLSSSAASVTFSSIPSTYTDLVLRMSARSDRATYTTRYWVLPNGATTSTSYTFINGVGNSTGSASATASKLYVSYLLGANQLADTFTNAEVYIPNYAGSTKKPMSSFGVEENNVASGEVEIAATAGLYNSTSAITSLTIGLDSTYNFVSGSSFYLYGIKNS